MNDDDLCSCPQDCQSISFDTEMYSLPFKSKVACSPKDKDYFQKFDPFSSVSFRRKFTEGADLAWTYKDVAPSNGKKSDNIDLTRFSFNTDGINDNAKTKRCTKQIKEQFAVLNIILDSPQVTRVLTDAKVSFSDRLGIIGMNLSMK